MTEVDVVDYILSKNKELKETYWTYQKLLTSIQNNNEQEFINILDNYSQNISDYIKTLIEFKDKILNTFKNKYHNGFIEGNNNFIKVLKRIAFGFR